MHLTDFVVKSRCIKVVYEGYSIKHEYFRNATKAHANNKCSIMILPFITTPSVYILSYLKTGGKFSDYTLNEN